MNELDWWIASQWEMFKIKEGKTGLEFNKTDKEGNVLTVDRTQKWNKLRAKTDLKELWYQQTLQGSFYVACVWRIVFQGNRRSI